MEAATPQSSWQHRHEGEVTRLHLEQGAGQQHAPQPERQRHRAKGQCDRNWGGLGRRAAGDTGSPDNNGSSQSKTRALRASVSLMWTAQNHVRSRRSPVRERIRIPGNVAERKTVLAIRYQWSNGCGTKGEVQHNEGASLAQGRRGDRARH